MTAGAKFRAALEKRSGLADYGNHQRIHRTHGRSHRLQGALPFGGGAAANSLGMPDLELPPDIFRQNNGTSNAHIETPS